MSWSCLTARRPRCAEGGRCDPRQRRRWHLAACGRPRGPAPPRLLPFPSSCCSVFARAHARASPGPRGAWATCVVSRPFACFRCTSRSRCVRQARSPAPFGRGAHGSLDMTGPERRSWPAAALGPGASLRGKRRVRTHNCRVPTVRHGLRPAHRASSSFLCWARCPALWRLGETVTRPSQGGR